VAEDQTIYEVPAIFNTLLLPTYRPGSTLHCNGRSTVMVNILSNANNDDRLHQMMNMQSEYSLKVDTTLGVQI